MIYICVEILVPAVVFELNTIHMNIISFIYFDQFLHVL